MSTNLIINEQTNLKKEYINDLENNRMFNYNFTPNINDINSRKSYINSIEINGILQDKNYDKNGDNIDDSTSLRYGNIQKVQSKKELDTRVFPGSPYMANGQSILKNTDLSSRLIFGEDTRTSKSNNIVSSYSANNFIPLVPSLEKNVQNIDHIIPTYWIRGGMSTRSVVRNIDYLKASGYKS